MTIRCSSLSRINIIREIYSKNKEFIDRFNNLHSSVTFTCEEHFDKRLYSLDVLLDEKNDVSIVIEVHLYAGTQVFVSSSSIRYKRK